MFQSARPRARARLVTCAARDFSALFQSARPRARARQCKVAFAVSWNPFQSARPRARARLSSVWLVFGDYCVSIRAPSGEGATLPSPRSRQSRQFQSARPRARARRLAEEAEAQLTRFNPRALGRGRDSASAPEPAEHCGFNPRALGRGRDFSLQLRRYRRRCFNPRALGRGRDLTLNPQTLSAAKFQSARPRARARLHVLRGVDR